MAKIDRVEDLPEWFDLKRYQECDKFGAVEWHGELSRRIRLFNLLKRLGKATSRLKKSFYINRISDLADQIRQIPIDPDNFPLFVYASPCRQPVRDISVHDLAMQAYRDEVASNDGLCSHGTAIRWMSISNQEFDPERLLEEEIKPVEINFYLPDVLPSAVILVDLSASDAVLKESFTAWLKRARARQAADIPKRSKPLHDRWARYGLLPYLDLLIWSIETDTHIPDRVMSAAISRHDAGEANLRKTIAPLAAELMRDLSELQALAAVEAAARTPAGEEVLEG